MKITLSPIERRALKAKAHALIPVVMIGDHGLTPAIIREIDRNLKAHELIKIRASTDDREQRTKWFDEICDALNAAPIQHIEKPISSGGIVRNSRLRLLRLHCPRPNAKHHG